MAVEAYMAWNRGIPRLKKMTNKNLNLRYFVVTLASPTMADIPVN